MNSSLIISKSPTIAAVVCFLPPGAMLAQSYTVTDLGTLHAWSAHASMALMSLVRPWALQDIRTARTHMHSSGRSRAVSAIWVRPPEAITALRLPSIIPAWL